MDEDRTQLSLTRLSCATEADAGSFSCKRPFMRYPVIVPENWNQAHVCATARVAAHKHSVALRDNPAARCRKSSFGRRRSKGDTDLLDRTRLIGCADDRNFPGGATAWR